MKKFVLIAITASVAMLTACANPSTKRIAERAITPSFDVDGVNWRNSGGILAVLYKLHDEGGHVGICGAYTFNKDLRGGGDSTNVQALNAMTLLLDDAVLMNDLTVFNRVPFPKTGFAKGNATCLVTERAWKAEYAKPKAAKLKISQNRFVVYE